MMEIEGCGWAMKLLGGQEDITPARDPARKRIGVRDRGKSGTPVTCLH